MSTAVPERRVIATYSRPKLLATAACGFVFGLVSIFALLEGSADALETASLVSVAIVFLPACSWLVRHAWDNQLLTVDGEGLACRTPRFEATWAEIDSIRLRRNPFGIYGSQFQLVVRFADSDFLQSQQRTRFSNPMLRWGGQAWIPLQLLHDRPTELFERIEQMADIPTRRVTARLDPSTWMDE